MHVGPPADRAEGPICRTGGPVCRTGSPRRAGPAGVGLVSGGGAASSVLCWPAVHCHQLPKWRPPAPFLPPLPMAVRMRAGEFALPTAASAAERASRWPVDWPAGSGTRRRRACGPRPQKAPRRRSCTRPVAHAAVLRRRGGHRSAQQSRSLRPRVARKKFSGLLIADLGRSTVMLLSPAPACPSHDSIRNLGWGRAGVDPGLIWG